MNPIAKRATYREIRDLAEKAGRLLNGEARDMAATRLISARLALAAGDDAQAKADLAEVRYYLNSRD